MADVTLLLRKGRGVAVLNGTQLTYDSTPSWPPDHTLGGVIDFSSRPSEEKGLLSAANQGAEADPVAAPCT